MAQHEQNQDSRDQDRYFRDETPIDVASAENTAALTPVASGGTGSSPYSWQCRDRVNPCSVDVPGSMDFPQSGDGTCEHGRLVYRLRDRG
ncbi:hypothetical protein ACIBBB_33930 [Streptomyces sp. NPDC051217]|uniref:hypothetical protein n=1 Tax=Streptomyces sp. NPDC051217 TaxID=3365644 RepID=UPI0037AFAEC7